MNKKILFLLSSILVAFFSAYSQPTISCPGVDAGNDTSVALSTSGCVFLSANPVSGFQPTDYTVGQIPYNPYPFNAGQSIIINIDDVWGPVTNLPFDFCFYGTNYNQAQPSSNGNVSFLLQPPGSFCPWGISAPIPDPFNAPLNCIMGPWHDINPSFGGNVFAQLYGTAPCRVYVVSWFSNAMFSCTGLLTTQQVAIYETTNIIEVYIQNKPLCTTWNSGAAILGVHNATGTAAVVAPGRNFPNQWSAVNEGWRWTPSGAPNYTMAWYQVGNPVPISTADTVTVCPVGCNTQYMAQATYTNCNGSTVVVTDTVLVVAANPNAQTNPTVTPPSCFNGTNGSISLNPTGGLAPYTYNWFGAGGNVSTLTGLGAGTYNVVITDGVGCLIVDSFLVTQPTQVVPTAVSTDALCFGASTGTAAASAVGGTPGYTYHWSNNANTATISGIPAGQYIVTVTDNNGCIARDTVQVLQPTQVVASSVMVPAQCFGQASGSATGSAVGGTPGYTYSWSPSGQATAVATNLAAGNHTVTVTDANGCTSTSTITVTQPSQLSAVSNHVDVSCNGGSNGSATVIASGGTPGYTYAWSPSGGSGATASNLAAGNYTCTITDNQGCSITRSFVILQPQPVAVVTFSTPEICVGFCNGSANAVAGGGTAPYTFSWSTGATTPSVINLCAGTYAVTMVDAQGCIATGSTIVTANPSPTADAGPDMSFCEGSGGVALNGSASGGGGTPYYYTWTCNTPPCGLSCVNCPNPIANPTDTTTYYLVVTDVNGCQSPPDSVVVNVLPKPVVNAGPDVTICGVPAPCEILTPTITNGQGPFTYQWSPSAGLNNAQILNPCARPDTSTIYALVVTDLSTGCTSELTTTDTLATVEVVVNPVPVADGGPNRVICDGDTTQLQGLATGAGPQYDFQWSPISGLSSYTAINPFAFPALTTNYTLVVWSNGCPSIADTVVVYVTEIPTVDAGQNRDICMSDSAFLDGNASVSNQVIPDSVASYLWTPPAGLSSTTEPDVMASPMQTGYYYLTATSAYGCTNTDSVLVTINPSPIVDAGLPITVCEGEGPWNLNGTLSWYNNVNPSDLQNVITEWQPAQYIVGANNTNSVQINPDHSMFFYFTVTYNTCSMTDSVLVTVVSEIHPIATADTNVICSGQSVGLHVTGGLGGGTISWTPAGSLDDATSSDPIATPFATTNYVVTISEGGCFGMDTVTVQVIETPKVAFASTFTEGCAPVEVNFTSLTSDGILVTWDFGDGSPRQNGSPITHTFPEPGTYSVMLYGVNTGGCSDSSDVATIVTVHDTVVPAFHSDPSAPVELMVPGGTVQFTDDTPTATQWHWDFGTGFTSSEENPSFNFTVPGTYFVTLMVQNQFGCSGTVMHGPYIVMMPDLFIPNVFSPNGDGVNDFFQIQYTGNQPFTLNIFDRWGVKQYVSNNKVTGWDGKNKDADSPAGVYYYTVKIGERDYTGNLTLVR